MKTFLFAVLAALSLGATWGQTSTLKKKCGNISKLCRANLGEGLRVVDATVIKQKRETECIKDDTYFVRDNGIEASGGCFAKFELSVLNEASGETTTQIMKCRSKKLICKVKLDAGFRVEDASVLKQKSGTPCVKGDNFFVTDTEIHTSGGCGAKFELQVQQLSIPPTTEEQAIVDKFNELRRIAAQTGPTNSATNMRKMYWDSGLANLAVQQADTCYWDYSALPEYTGRPLPGLEIRGFGKIYDVQSTSHWDDVLEAWYYSYEDEEYGPILNSYPLISQDSTFRVGCAWNFCKQGQDTEDGDMYFCYYGTEKPVYNGDEPAFNDGLECGDCSGNCDNGLCDCGDVVCLNGASLNLDTCTCQSLP